MISFYVTEYKCVTVYFYVHKLRKTQIEFYEAEKKFIVYMNNIIIAFTTLRRL